MNYKKLIEVFLIAFFIAGCTDVTFDNVLDLRGTKEFSTQDSLLAMPWPAEDPEAEACRYNPDCPYYVKDTVGPILTLTGNNPTSIPYGDPDNILARLKESVEAYDEFENKHYSSDEIFITYNDVAVFVPGTYKIVYEAIDESNNSTEEERAVIVLKKEEKPINNPPSIFIKYPGGGDIVITQGDNFEVTEYFGASDVEDKDLGDDDLIINGEFNTNNTGTYSLSVSVTDSDGEKTSRDFNLVVKEKDIENHAPTLTLKGELELTLDFFEDYVEEGWEVDDPDGDSVTVDTSIQDIGTKIYIVYTAKDEHDLSDRKLSVKSRTIILRQGNPVIHIDGGDDPRIVFVGEEFEPPEAWAEDTDGKEIDKIQIKPETISTSDTGTYIIEYYAVDSKERSTIKKIIVYVKRKDKTPPEITILGSKDTVLYIGDSYTHPDAEAYDEYDDDTLTEFIEVDGENDVNTDEVGTYFVIYTVSDSSGNIAKDTVKVTVKLQTSQFLDYYGVPAEDALPSIEAEYRSFEIEGDDPPTISNVNYLTFKWDLSRKTFDDFSISRSANPYHVVLAPLITHNLDSTEPSFELKGSGIDGLDGEYYITLDEDDNLVWVQVDGDYAIIWSE